MQIAKSWKIAQIKLPQLTSFFSNFDTICLVNYKQKMVSAKIGL